MIKGILYSGINIDRVVNFCGEKVAYSGLFLYINSLKEKEQVVHPTDFIFKSSNGNLTVRTWNQFFSAFKANDTDFEPSQLTHEFTISV